MEEEPELSPGGKEFLPPEGGRKRRGLNAQTAEIEDESDDEDEFVKGDEWAADTTAVNLTGTRSGYGSRYTVERLPGRRVGVHEGHWLPGARESRRRCGPLSQRLGALQGV